MRIEDFSAKISGAVKFGSLVLVLTVLACGGGEAQTAGNSPNGVQTPVATGSATTIVEGKSAQRMGDRNAPGAIVTQTSPDVFIDGRPAAIAGGCGNGVSVGSSSVFINGKPAAIAGGGSAPCPK